MLQRRFVLFFKVYWGQKYIGVKTGFDAMYSSCSRNVISDWLIGVKTLWQK